jgi:hypothetical protein
MPIEIPVDVHLITIGVIDYQITTRTIQVGPRTRTQRERVQTIRTVAPRHTEASVRRAFDGANTILTQVDVCFELRSFTPRTVEMPSSSDTVDRQGFLYLAGQCPARDGVSLMLVANFSSRELGGEALEDRSVCIVAFLDDQLQAKVLAHEFAHLLALDHVNRDLQDRYNLMYPGLSADTRLTAEQRRVAQTSRLARQFSEAGNQPRAATAR